MKVVILSITPYKEKGAIIDALSEDGDISFSVRSIFDPKSKDAFLNCPLLIADVTFSEGNYKYQTLKSASSVLSPMKVTSDYYYLSTIMLIAEATKKMMQEEERKELFPLLCDAVKALKDSHNPLSVAIIYLSNIIKVSGYNPNVNGCAKCGSKNNIVAFSFEEGGFICKDCVDDAVVRDLNNEQMLMLRQAFLVNDFSKEIGTENADLISILDKYFHFISDSFGTALKSSKLFIK